MSEDLYSVRKQIRSYFGFWIHENNRRTVVTILDEPKIKDLYAFIDDDSLSFRKKLIKLLQIIQMTINTRDMPDMFPNLYIPQDMIYELTEALMRLELGDAGHEIFATGGRKIRTKRGGTV